MQENILSPSILSADFGHLSADMEETVRAGATWAHIDVMDGLFVPQISIGIPVVKSVRKGSDLFLDTHLMIQDPIRYVADFAKAGADLITFHIEAAKDPQAVIDEIHVSGKKAGISIKPGTPVSALKPFADKVDLILVMTVEPGFGGQKYNDDCTQKIRETRALLQETGSRAELEVDGGVKLSNLQMVLDAGANVIVAGSAIYGGDIYGNTRAFLEKMK